MTSLSCKERIYVDAVKIVGVHNGALKELDLGEMALKQSFQLQVRLFPIQCNIYTCLIS